MASQRQWPSWGITRLKPQLLALAEAVRDRPSGRTDDEQIWLTRFLVVRICGYLEQVVYETVREYIREKSGGLVRSFASSWVTRTRNPSPENLLELVGRFDSNLADDLQSLLHADDQHLLRELSLLVDRRNKIAHGMNEGLTERKALSLLADVEVISQWFLANMKPYR